MAGSKQEIMEATYKALCKHGYADLSIQRIADESDKGKSLIYYHYDDKEDLMVSFLDFLEEGLQDIHDDIMERPADERIDEFMDIALGLKDDEHWEFQKAFLEIRAQAAHNPKFSEKFRQMDELVVSNIEEMFDEAGIEDSKNAAEVFASCIEGAASRKVSVNDKEGLGELKKNIRRCLEAFKS